jgi:hypothetical protein
MSTPRWAKQVVWFSVVACLLVCAVAPGTAADAVLNVTLGGETRHFARDALLARSDATSVEIADDVAYGRAMRFRAVPLAALLAGLSAPDDSVIETIAEDGFAAQLPLALVTNTDPAKAVAWLAIEPADASWPPLPGKTASAGPFYVVWTGAGVAAIRSEQWPYQVVKLVDKPSPVGAGRRSTSTRRCPRRTRFAPGRRSTSSNACLATCSAAPAPAPSAPT